MSVTRNNHYTGKILENRYEIINRVGSGGSAVVYGAYDSIEERTVAIKMLRREFENDEEEVARFEQEAGLLSLFNHDGIVKVYDTHITGSPKYFIMEYIEGITLKNHILQKGALSEGEIYMISKQILSALAEVHSKGIVHSDIKPHNVVILPNGVVKLMDFGISKNQSETRTPESEDETSDIAVGTVQYVSPEQAEGKRLDKRSDLYSMGVLMYEMATGIPPYFDDTPARIAAMHINNTPLLPSDVNPSINKELDFVILQAMEKSIEGRYQSAEEMLDAVKKAENPFLFDDEPATLLEKIKDFFYNFSIVSGITGALCALLVSTVLALGVLSMAVKGEHETHEHIKAPSLKGEFFTSVDDLGIDLDYYDVTVNYKESRKNAGEIINQSPRGGKVTLLERGKKMPITITVAYLPLTSEMPNVVALTNTDARILLGRYNCTVNEIHVPHAFFEKGRVFASRPRQNEEASEVATLYVSDGYYEKVVAVPDFSGLNVKEALDLAYKEGFTLVTVEGDGDIITSQSVENGKSVNAPDTEIILKAGTVE